MSQPTYTQQSPSAFKSNNEYQNTLVILSPTDAHGSLVLKGVFGQLVSKDEQNNELEIRLDEQIVDCSAIFSSYSGGATFKINADEAIIIHSDNSAAIESLKATLAAALAHNWGRRYRDLMESSNLNGLVRQALNVEMTTALNGAQALIESKNAHLSSIPISAFTIIDREEGNLNEIVLLKEPLSTTIPSDASSDFLDLDDLDYGHGPFFLRHDGQLNVMLTQGVSIQDFSTLLAQSDKATALAVTHFSAGFSGPTLLSAQQAILDIEKNAVSRVSGQFSQALNAHANANPDQPHDRIVY